MKTKKLSDRFEIAYNIIVKKLIEINKMDPNKDYSFPHLLNITKHASTNAYKDELKKFAELRNTIVHNKISEGYYIAEPHVDIVEKIEKIAKDISNPKKALEISTKNPTKFYEKQNISVVLNVIKQYDYSSFPVYNKSGDFVGLLTTNGITKWLAATTKEEGLIFEDYDVGDILPFEYHGNVEFISELDDVYLVKEMFEKQLTKTGNKLETIIISNGRNKKEHNLRGIITPWDLVKI